MYQLSVFKDLSAKEFDVEEIYDLSQFSKLAEYPTKAAQPLISLCRFGETPNEKGCLRYDGNVLDIQGVIGDYDAGITPIQDAFNRLKVSYGLTCVVLTTATPGRWRVLAPTSRELPPSEHQRLTGILNAMLDGTLAKESFTLSQSYYFGRVAGVPFEALVNDGRFIDEIVCVDPVYPVLEAQRMNDGDYVTSTAIEDWTRHELEDALNFIAANTVVDRSVWVNVGQNLKSLGETGFTLWHNWSKQVPKYKDENDCRKTWYGLDGTKSDYPAVFAKAYSLDWVKPEIDLSNVGFGVDIVLPPGATLEPPPPAKEKKKAVSTEKDSKLAENLAVAMCNYFTYDLQSSSWFEYDNNFWHELPDEKFLRALSAWLKDYVVGGFSASKRSSVEKLLRSELLSTGWTTDHHLVPLMNGVLNLQTRTLEPYSDAYRFNWQLPYRYDPTATCPVFLTWLTEAVNVSGELGSNIRYFFKSIITGQPSQKFLELIGPGGTGKSTLIRILKSLLNPDSVHSTTLKMLEGNEFEAANLYGKKLVIINDSDKFGGELSILKAATGGDPLPYNRKFIQGGKPFIYTGGLVIVANQPIQSSDYTSGLARRRMPVYLENLVTTSDKEKWSHCGGIENAIAAELPGVLNWVLGMHDSYFDEIKNGINGQLSQNELRHLIETNPIARFLNECCLKVPGAKTYVGNASNFPSEDSTKLYERYQWWCAACGHHKVSLVRFSNGVLDVSRFVGWPIEKANRDATGTGLMGIRLKMPSDGLVDRSISNEA